jgi:AcrR family transcriptional regulator
MPKSFTEAEKAYIRERLLREAEACLNVYGIRRTTVDEIVKRAGIPKGTFYLFYESKEALIFDVILKLNTEIQARLLHQIAGMERKPDAEQLTDIIFSLYQSLDGSFLLKLVESGELEFYMQKAPPEFARANALDDEQMVGRLMALFPAMDAERSRLYSAALRGAFLLMLHKKDIAYERFDEMLRLMVRGIILQMFGE